MISNIQVLRALAALAVAFYHTDFRINGDVHTEFQGVAIFFVISGFIMTFITRERHEGFLWGRATRIVPLYWVMTLASVAAGWLLFAAALAVRNVGVDAVHQSCIFCHVWDWLTDPAKLSELAKSLLFIPYVDKSGLAAPLLGVGWTLNLEIFFYLLFWIALAMSASFAPLLVCLALIGIKLLAFIVWRDAPAPLLVSFYAHDYTTYFVFGIATFYAWRTAARLPHDRVIRALTVAISLLLLVAFLMFEAQALPASWYDGISDRLLVAAFPPAIVLAALMFHSLKLQFTSRLIIKLGDASYALYLLHTIVYGIASPLWRRFPATDPKNGVVALVIVLVACCALAVLVHDYIEKPMIAWLRSARRRSPPRSTDITA